MPATTIQKIISAFECSILNEKKMGELGLSHSPGLKAPIIETFHIYEGHEPESQNEVLMCPGKRGSTMCAYEGPKWTECIRYR